MDFQLIGEGMTAKVYLKGNRAIKLYLRASMEQVQEEAMKQSFAESAGLPVPKVYGVELFEGGIALEMDYVEGAPLLHPRMDKDERKGAFCRWVALQNAVHRVDATGLPRLSERLAWRIARADLDAGRIAALLSRLHALDSDAHGLCHGDFHPLNILVEQGGEVAWIIDWVDAASGDPLADACRSYLICRYYLPRMANAYLKLFCETSGVERSNVLEWLPIVAAARLGENLTNKEKIWLREICEKG